MLYKKKIDFLMISYMGGKSRIGKWIVPFIPNDIETYVEPFSGMFWVYFNMDIDEYKKLKTVVYNDYNPLNSNLFKCSLEYDKLWKELSMYPCQQLNEPNTPNVFSEMFYRFQKEIFDDNYIIGDEPNFEAAAKYAYVLTQIYSGGKPKEANYMDYKGKYRCKLLVFMDKLKNPKYRKNLDKINFVESNDFEDVIKKYDSKNTYFYVDPPYFKTENYYSNHEFGFNDHERLSNILKNIEGKFSLSYYDFPLLDVWFPKNEYVWNTKLFSKASSASKGKKQNKGEELLITNYEIE